MMLAPVSAVFAAILGVLLVVLALQVSRFRLRYKKGMGCNDDPAFEAAIRAHANLAEYGPLGLIMLAIAELNGVASGMIYWVGLAFVLGRILHAFGMINGQGRPHKARMLGVLLTWLSILVIAGLLLWNVYLVNR